MNGHSGPVALAAIAAAGTPRSFEFKTMLRFMQCIRQRRHAQHWPTKRTHLARTLAVPVVPATVRWSPSVCKLSANCIYYTTTYTILPAAGRCVGTYMIRRHAPQTGRGWLWWQSTPSTLSEQEWQSDCAGEVSIVQVTGGGLRVVFGRGFKVLLSKF